MTPTTVLTTVERPRITNSNAKRTRQLVNLLVGRVLTINQIAADCEISRDAAARALWRLRREMDVDVVAVGEEEPETQGHGGNHGEIYYTILFPAGRVCTRPGCGTVLCRRNPAGVCSVHGGWTL